MAISGRRRVGIVAVVAALAVGALGVVSVHADPTPDLPPIGADPLLASSLAALVRPFTVSGTVDTRFDLGIPQLPSNLSGGAESGLAGAISLLTGDQRYKVWRAPDGVRIAHLLAFSEQDLVANASDAWFWDSSDMSAIHIGVPGLMAGGPVPSAVSANDADLMTLVRRALDAVAPYARVSVDTASTVAGRPTYTLVLTPTSPLTLIGRIALAIDAETRLPLRLQVFPRGSDAVAVEAGFTAVSFDAIDPSMFSFTPPPGTTVRQAADVIAAAANGPGGDGASPVSQHRIFGRGFDLRVAVRLDTPLPAGADALLPYAGPLLSAIMVERNGQMWLLVGPVSVATLEKDAASLP
ncbi:MAG: LolA family protein [Actinomycetota bacterium]